MAQRKLTHLEEKFERGKYPSGKDFGFLFDSSVNYLITQLYTDHEELDGDLKLDIQNDKTVIHTKIETTDITSENLIIDSNQIVQNNLNVSDTLNTPDISTPSVTVSDSKFDSIIISGAFEPKLDGEYNLGTSTQPVQNIYLSTSVTMDSLTYKEAEAGDITLADDDKSIVIGELVIPEGIVVTIRDNAILVVTAQ